MSKRTEFNKYQPCININSLERKWYLLWFYLRLQFQVIEISGSKNDTIAIMVMRDNNLFYIPFAVIYPDITV